MQADTFADERMKIRYTLSFMCWGTAQMWAANETTAIMDGRLHFHTLDEILANIKRTFGDPDWARTAHMQLHKLKMTQGMTAEDYMARFEMLAGRTGFNNEALKDAYIRGLPYSILQKVYAQTALPNGLDGWKTVIHNLDRLHQALMELKQSTGQTNPWAVHTSPSVTNATNWPTPAIISSPQTTDTSTPMDIGQHKPHIETCTCYNCNKLGHISPNCLEP